MPRTKGEVCTAALQIAPPGCWHAHSGRGQGLGVQPWTTRSTPSFPAFAQGVPWWGLCCLKPSHCRLDDAVQPGTAPQLKHADSPPDSRMQQSNSAHVALCCRSGIGQLTCPDISREEIVNACGIDDFHDGVNYTRTACGECAQQWPSTGTVPAAVVQSAALPHIALERSRKL